MPTLATPEAYESRRNEFLMSCDPKRLDRELIYQTLSQLYWAINRPRELVERSLDHSLCFGVYTGDEQVGLARVITDYATFAYLCDVFILEEYQGHGLGKWLIEQVVNHPDLRHLRRTMLATRDAHGLYTQYGFQPLERPEIWMEIYRPTSAE